MEESNLDQNPPVNPSQNNPLGSSAEAQQPVQPVENQTQVSKPANNNKLPLILIGAFILLIVLGSGAYLLKISNVKSQNSNPQLKSQNLTPTLTAQISPTVIQNNVLKISLKEGETTKVPGTDIKIKALWVSAICKNVPPPNCKNEATLEFSHIELKRSRTFYTEGSTAFNFKREESSVEIFFGHKIELISLNGKQITLTIEIPQEIPADKPNWLTFRSKTGGFELQQPEVFELRDWGKTSGESYDIWLENDYWLSIDTSDKERMNIDLYNNISINNDIAISLDEFYAKSINPNAKYTKPKKISLSNKKMLEITSEGRGRNKILFWVDPEKRKGVQFQFPEDTTKNLDSFYNIIESFRFL